MTIHMQTFTFHCRFTTDARLPGYLGSTLRGAMGWSLKRTTCALRRQQCAGCLLRQQCVYAWIFETEQYRDTGGRTINARPHPFVLQPGGCRENMQPGESISFSLLLLDRAVEMLPHLVYAVRIMGESGIGSGRRQGLGRFALQQVTTDGQTIYSADTETLASCPEPSCIGLGKKTGCGPSLLKVYLLTPLRFKQGNRMKTDLPFHNLVRVCLRRIAALEEAYGDGEPDLDYLGLVEQARQVEVQDSSIRWQKLYRWSNRQRQNTSLSGLAGSITYSGELGEFLPILRYGEQVNIGKQTVFGLGKIAIKPRKEEGAS